MGAVNFYHLTRSSPQSALLSILPKAVDLGWRILIRADEAVLTFLDDALWQGPETSFLAHGLAGGAQDAEQPILLGNISGAGFDGAVLIAPDTLDLTEAAQMQRVWILFEDSDQAQVSAARALWQDVVKAGLTAQYYSEESGRWALKTSANAAPQPA